MLEFIFILMVGMLKGVMLMSGLVIDTEKKEPYWITYVNNRIKKNKNFIVFISGSTGSGKTWSGISLACMLDKTFSPKDIVFGFSGLMKLINSGEKFKSGKVFMWDEFQIEGSARTWQSLTNRLLNSLISTFRHKNFILIITAPYQDFIDAQSRKLLHAEFQTMSIDYKKKTTKLKPFLIQYNSRIKKFYYKYLRVRTKLGTSPLKAWNIPQPPKWIIEEYELMKTRFTDKLNKDIEKQLNKLQGKEEDKRKPLTEIQEKVLSAMAKYGNVRDTARELGKAERTIRFHNLQIRKKGYSIEEIEDKGG